MIACFFDDFVSTVTCDHSHASDDCDPQVVAVYVAAQITKIIVLMCEIVVDFYILMWEAPVKMNYLDSHDLILPVDIVLMSVVVQLLAPF